MGNAGLRRKRHPPAAAAVPRRDSALRSPTFPGAAPAPRPWVPPTRAHLLPLPPKYGRAGTQPTRGRTEKQKRNDRGSPTRLRWRGRRGPAPPARPRCRLPGAQHAPPGGGPPRPPPPLPPPLPSEAPPRQRTPEDLVPGAGTSPTRPVPEGFTEVPRCRCRLGSPRAHPRTPEPIPAAALGSRRWMNASWQPRVRCRTRRKV